MASSSPAWAVELATRPSRFHQGLILVLHALALLALLQAGGLPAWLRLAVATAVLASAWLAWRGERGRGDILREVGEQWWLEGGDHRGMATLVRARAWRYLVVMDFAGEWQGRRWRRQLVIWPDAVAPDDFRRLRVRLRCGAVPGRPAIGPSRTAARQRKARAGAAVAGERGAASRSRPATPS